MVRSITIKKGGVEVVADSISLTKSSMLSDGKNNVTVVTNVPNRRDWYTTFIENRKAWIDGVIRDKFVSKGGKRYITSIQGTVPDKYGRLVILGEKYLDVSCDESGKKLAITKSSSFYDIGTYYETLYRMSGELYKAINSISARFTLFDPYGEEDISLHTYRNNRCHFGPMLASLLQYQALVARWNHHAWKSSMVFNTSEAAGATAFCLGFTNLDCVANNVKIDAVIVADTDSDDYPRLHDADGHVVSDDKYSAARPIYTLYYNGDDKNINKKANIDTRMYRNWDPDDTEHKKDDFRCDGSGFLASSKEADKRPWEMETLLRLDISITITSPEGVPAFKAEQYFNEAFAIAIPTGVLKTYSPNTSGTRIYYHYYATITWTIDGRVYEKTGELIRVPAADVHEVNSGNDEGGE